MIKRSTVVMVVLLALLAGLTYYLQQPNNLITKALASPATATTEPLGSLLPLNAGPLQKITIRSADGQTVTIDSKSDTWMLTIGNAAPVLADQTQANEAATQALSLSLVDRIQVTGSDLSVYGLATPAYTLTCILVDKSTFTAKIGKPTVTGSGYYVQKEDGSVVIVDKAGIESLLNILKQPPLVATDTPTSVPSTATQNPAEAATPTPLSELTPTKQP